MAALAGSVVGGEQLPAGADRPHVEHLGDGAVVRGETPPRPPGRRMGERRMPDRIRRPDACRGVDDAPPAAAPEESYRHPVEEPDGERGSVEPGLLDSGLNSVEHA